MRSDIGLYHLCIYWETYIRCGVSFPNLKGPLSAIKNILDLKYYMIVVRKEIVNLCSLAGIYQD